MVYQYVLASKVALNRRVFCGRLERPVSALTIFVYIENILSMFDLSNIVGFDWDEGNSRKKARKGMMLAKQKPSKYFSMSLYCYCWMKSTAQMNRGTTHTVKLTTKKTSHCVYLRDEDTLIHVISARNMHRKRD